jgi:hypothetical protein
MAGAIIGKGGHNIQKLRTEVCMSNEMMKNLLVKLQYLCFRYPKAPPQKYQTLFKDVE